MNLCNSCENMGSAGEGYCMVYQIYCPVRKRRCKYYKPVKIERVA